MKVFSNWPYIAFCRLSKFLSCERFRIPAEDLLPVRAAFDLVHAPAGDQRARAGHRLVLALFGGMQMLVVVIERLVVVIQRRYVRVGEDFRQHADAVAHARLQLAVDFTYPAALPFFLIFPGVRIPDAGLAFHVIEPGVFHTFTAGPDVLQVTEQVWQPMHLSRFSTMPTCERIFICCSPADCPARSRCLRRPTNQCGSSCAPPRTRRGWSRRCRSS